MKNFYIKYKNWKLEKIIKWNQWYANFIMARLQEAKSDWEFDFWLYKGLDLDSKMVNKYNVYLD